MVKTFKNIDIDSIKTIVEYLLFDLKNYSVFLLEGNLGAGKSYLIREILKKLGVTQDIQSPTFTLINQFRIENKLYIHADLYRITNPNQLIEIGFEEAIDNATIAFIEWPKIGIDFFMSPDVVHIEIIHQNNTRDYIIKTEEI